MADTKDIAAGSYYSRSRNFVSESIDELKKVSKPTRQETIQATAVALVIMLFVAMSLFILDQIFNTLMRAVLG